MPILTGVTVNRRHITLGNLDFALPRDGLRITGLKLEGWDSSAGTTLTLTQKTRQHGAWRSSQPRLKAKTMVLSGMAQAADVPTIIAFIDELNAACSLEESRLLVEDPGVDPRYHLVSRQDDVLWAPTENQLIKRFSAQLVAADSRKHADDLTGSTGLPHASGGLTVPFTVPFAINSTVAAGQVALTNPGNVTGNVRLRITGPVAGPIVTHVNSGVQLVFSTSLVLGAGEWVDVDMEAQTVLAQGQASRSTYVLSRGWSGFEPGPNVWAFSAAAFDPAARLYVSASPSWL